MTVTEDCEVFSWSYFADDMNHLSHGVDALQRRPKRIEGLIGVKVAAAAMCPTHTLVADEDGVVWGFGHRCALGLDDLPPAPEGLDPGVEHPTPIPALRMRARKSPPVARLWL